VVKLIVQFPAQFITKFNSKRIVKVGLHFAKVILRPVAQGLFIDQDKCIIG